MTTFDAPIYWSLVDPYFREVSIYDGPSIFLKHFETIPEPSQHLLTTHWTQSEIRNGGFLQYFLNNTGVLAPEAVIGFERLGMNQTSDLLKQAIGLIGPSYPRDRDEREVILAEVFPDSDFDEDVDIDDPYPFDELDRRMFVLLDSEKGGFEASADAFALAHTK